MKFLRISAILLTGLIAISTLGVASAATIPAVDVVSQAGLAQVTTSWGSWPYDYDHDGWTDVLVGRHAGGVMQIYHNDQGHFSLVPHPEFKLNDKHGCAWGDVNNDGLVDIYCLLGADKGTGAKNNELWMQQPDGSFVNMGKLAGVGDLYGRGRRPVMADFNHDGWLDIYVSNDYPRSDAFKSPNRLFMNLGVGTFRDAVEYGLDKEIGGDCTQAVDYNHDGWMDIFVCSHSGVKLYRNNAGSSFTDVSASMNLTNNTTRWTGAYLADFNNDGRIDLVETNRTWMQIRLQTTAGKFNLTPIAGQMITRGFRVGVGDYNGDGWQDVYEVQDTDGSVPNVPDVLWQNNGAGTGFEPVALPQADTGSGESVTPFDYNNDGKTDFLVMNGYVTTGPAPVAGPIQLITQGPSN